MYTIQVIAEVIGGTFSQKGAPVSIAHLEFDSRSISYPTSSLFFALSTQRQNGHQYIEDAYQKGVRAFVTSQTIFKFSIHAQA